MDSTEKEIHEHFQDSSIVLNNYLLITFYVPINIQPQEPIHQGSLHHQVNILCDKIFYIIKYSNRSFL